MFVVRIFCISEYTIFWIQTRAAESWRSLLQDVYVVGHD